jgi:uncharacterized protein YdeI (YjbR/CyaY-like superfamily)
MPKTDPRVDAYIAKSADFAKPILNHLRRLVHLGCPEVEETWKWSFPHFMYKGILCSMAAFKNHCSFGFWKGRLILGKSVGDGDGERDGMGQFGRLTSLADLPPEKVLLGYIIEAVRLNDAGVKVPTRSAPRVKKDLVVPDYFLAALNKQKKALRTFEDFSYSHKKEYVEWITEAKTEPTREKRIITALAWLAGGKPRYWKYANC